MSPEKVVPLVFALACSATQQPPPPIFDRDAPSLALTERPAESAAPIPVACPQGATWDGRVCMVDKIVCPEGAELVNHECLATRVNCPEGTEWLHDACFPLGTTLARKKPTGNECALNINSIPAAEVMVDGRKFGSTPQMGLVLPAGSHSVIFVALDAPFRKSVTVTCRAGATSTVAVRLDK